MTFDLINNAALLLAICWLQSLITQRWTRGTLQAQVLSGMLFSVATIVVMMTSILLAPGLWLWTDSSMAVVGVATFCYGPIAGGLAMLAGMAYQWWIGGLIASGAIINLAISFAIGLAWLLLLGKRTGKTSGWLFLLFGFVIYGIGSWQLFTFHLPQNDAVGPEFFTTLLLIMAPATALLGLQLQYIERKSTLEKEVQYLAHYDTLTGLPNRNKTVAELKGRMDVASQKSFSVIIFYLQNFQLFNESLGAEVGDFILKEVTDKITAAFGNQVFIARYSGLEFLVIKPETGAGTDTLQACNQIRAALDSPVQFHDKKLKINVAMGAARFPDDAQAPYELLRKASIALQEARDTKASAVIQFNGAMEQSVQESLDIRKSLTLALENNELEVFYQPYIRLTDGGIEGIEALIRWNHPKYGLKGPAFFLEAAEKSGLITTLGSWVIEAACRKARKLQDMGIQVPLVSVNVSLIQLADGSFPDRIAAILKKSGLDAGALMLEITETTILKQSETMLDTATALRAMGVRFAIDNFGNDYTNIGFMKTIGVHMLKVDRDYIAHLVTQAESRQMASAFIQIARSLGILALAVGVEDEAGRDVCRELGFDMAQGYFYCRPLDSDRLIEFLS